MADPLFWFEVIVYIIIGASAEKLTKANLPYSIFTDILIAWLGHRLADFVWVQLLGLPWQLDFLFMVPIPILRTFLATLAILWLGKRIIGRLTAPTARV